LEAKRIELLKEIVPGLRRLASIRDFRNPTTATQWRLMQTAAQTLTIELLRFDVRNLEDVSRAFTGAVDEKVEALVIAVDTVTSTYRRQIIDLAARHKLPAIYEDGIFIYDGGLMSYGVSYPQLYYRAASFVDKIFKGSRPADLPVEQPTKFEFVFNLKTARALGITVPPSLVSRADDLIE
jgi:putative ABC transport system substrate-binding protein